MVSSTPPAIRRNGVYDFFDPVLESLHDSLNILYPLLNIPSFMEAQTLPNYYVGDGGKHNE